MNSLSSHRIHLIKYFEQIVAFIMMLDYFYSFDRLVRCSNSIHLRLSHQYLDHLRYFILCFRKCSPLMSFCSILACSNFSLSIIFTKINKFVRLKSTISLVEGTMSLELTKVSFIFESLTNLQLNIDFDPIQYYKGFNLHRKMDFLMMLRKVSTQQNC